MAAIILSGGENRRMGRNKAFLTFKGKMFLWMIIEALTPIFRELILVTREPLLYSGFPVRTVPDLLPERGPLTGVVSGLLFCRERKNFVIGCDMPLLKTALVQYMMNMANGFDAVVPAFPGSDPKSRIRLEPLHAVYDRHCLPLLQRNLRAGKKSLGSLVQSMNARYLYPEEMRRFDRDLRGLRSVNTPEEYRALPEEVPALERVAVGP